MLSTYQAGWEAGAKDALSLLPKIEKMQWDALRDFSYDANRGWNEGKLHVLVMRLEAGGEIQL